MSISDDTIRRAAEALYARDSVAPEPIGLKELVIEMYRQDILTALPILRDAIRAEIVQEIDALLMDDRCEVFGVNQSFPGVYGWYDGDDVQCYPSLAELLAARESEVSQ